MRRSFRKSNLWGSPCISCEETEEQEVLVSNQSGTSQSIWPHSIYFGRDVSYSASQQSRDSALQPLTQHHKAQLGSSKVSSPFGCRDLLCHTPTPYTAGGRERWPRLTLPLFSPGAAGSYMPHGRAWRTTSPASAREGGTISSAHYVPEGQARVALYPDFFTLPTPGCISPSRHF